MSQLFDAAVLDFKQLNIEIIKHSFINKLHDERFLGNVAAADLRKNPYRWKCGSSKASILHPHSLSTPRSSHSLTTSIGDLKVTVKDCYE